MLQSFEGVWFCAVFIHLNSVMTKGSSCSAVTKVARLSLHQARRDNFRIVLFLLLPALHAAEMSDIIVHVVTGYKTYESQLDSREGKTIFLHESVQTSSGS